MSRVITAFVLLAIMVTAGILEHINVDNTFDEMKFRAEEIDELIKEGDIEAALQKCAETAKWWDSKRDLIEAFSYSPDTRLLSVTIGEIEGSLIADDLKNAQSKVTSLLYLIDNVHNVLDFNFQDIF
jgi:hypothetical protein